MPGGYPETSPLLRVLEIAADPRYSNEYLGMVFRSKREALRDEHQDLCVYREMRAE